MYGKYIKLGYILYLYLNDQLEQMQVYVRVLFVIYPMNSCLSKSNAYDVFSPARVMFSQM